MNLKQLGILCLLGMHMVTAGEVIAQRSSQSVDILSIDDVPLSTHQTIQSNALLNNAVVSDEPTTGNFAPGLYDETAATQREELANSQGEFIDPFSGSLNLSHTDLILPGAGGLDIEITRFYSSNNVHRNGFSPTPQSDDTTPRVLKAPSLLGVGWDMHFGRVKRNRSDACTGPDGSTNNNPILETPDGSQKQFFYNNTLPNRSNAVYVTSDFWSAYCINGSSGILVVSPDGIRYTMGYRAQINGKYVWSVSEIRDRNNNWIKFSYNVYENVVRIGGITTSDDRRVNFTYYINSSRLRWITAGNRIIKYSYGYQYKFLTNVNHGENRIQKYGYNSNNLLSYFKRQAGGYTNYSYELQCKALLFGCGRITRTQSVGGTIIQTSVVMLKRWMINKKIENDSNGRVSNWYFRYASDKFREYTTVTFPGGKYIYTHFGGHGERIHNPPYHKFTFERLNLYGYLLSKAIYDDNNLIQTDTYTYQNVKISNQNISRFPLSFALDYSNSDVYFTRLVNKKIMRNGKNYSTGYFDFNNNQYPNRIVESGEANKVTNISYRNISSALSSAYVNLVYIKEDEKLGTTSNRIIDRNFDVKGNLTNINEFGVKTQYTYHSSGDVASMTNAMNHKTFYSSYYRGIPREERLPEYVTLRRTVNYNGLVTSETNGRGYRTVYEYDTIGRVKKITPPAGSTTVVGWGVWGSALSLKDVQTLIRGGFLRRIYYDGFGRPVCDVKETIYEGTTYDALGRVTSKTYPNYSSCNTSARESYRYDILGRLTRTTQVDGAYSSFTYYSNNVTRYRDENGNIYDHTYRSFGDPSVRQLMQIRGPESLLMKIQRNLLGQVLKIEHQGIHTYAYDNSYFVQRESHPQTGMIQYKRNNLGLITARTVASKTTTYNYDQLQRIKSVNYPGSTPDVNYNYDKNNNLIRLQSGVSDFVYSYDSNNNLIEEKQKIENTTYVIKNSYSSMDYLTKITYPDNSSISYSPDDLGRPTQASPYVTKATYHPNGLVNQINYANGRTSTFTINSRQFPQRMITDGDIINREYNSYDPAGNIKSIKDYHNASNNRSMTYDGQQRLKTANGPWGTGAISYDAAGNIKSKRMGSINLAYTYLNNKIYQLSGVPDFGGRVTMSYDGYGNVVNKKSPSHGWHYDFDDASNLRQAFDNSGQLLRSFEYSGDRMRVSNKSASEHRRYIYARSGNLLSEIKVSGGKPTIHNYYLGSTLIAEKEINARGRFRMLPILMDYFLDEDE